MSPNDSPAALIVDSDTPHTRALRRLLVAAGFEVSVTASPDSANTDPDVAFVNVDVPGVEPARAVAGETFGRTREIVLMATPEVASAAKEMVYYFAKPFDPDFVPMLVAAPNLARRQPIECDPLLEQALSSRSLTNSGSMNPIGWFLDYLCATHRDGSSEESPRLRSVPPRQSDALVDGPDLSLPGGRG